MACLNHHHPLSVLGAADNALCPSVRCLGSAFPSPSCWSPAAADFHAQHREKAPWPFALSRRFRSFYISTWLRRWLPLLLTCAELPCRKEWSLRFGNWGVQTKNGWVLSYPRNWTAPGCGTASSTCSPCLLCMVSWLRVKFWWTLLRTRATTWPDLHIQPSWSFCVVLSVLNAAASLGTSWLFLLTLLGNSFLL